MKKAIAIILCSVMISSLCGCTNYGKPGFYHDEGSPFVSVEKGLGWQVLVHKETGVAYIYHYDGNRAGLSVMLNPDGTPYVWEAHNGE